MCTRLLWSLAIFVACSEIALACSGCGCRGGPGYRGPDGRCVGWAQLNNVCGHPPASRCKYEGKQEVATPKAGDGKGNFQANPLPLPKWPLPNAGPASNVQKTRSSGIGCREQTDTHILSTCVSGAGRDCVGERAKLIAEARCTLIPDGVSVVIEAGSHSFDWLRIRVPGHTAPLWTERQLVLER